MPLQLPNCPAREAQVAGGKPNWRLACGSIACPTCGPHLAWKPTRTTRKMWAWIRNLPLVFVLKSNPVPIHSDNIITIDQNLKRIRRFWDLLKKHGFGKVHGALFSTEFAPMKSGSGSNLVLLHAHFVVLTRLPRKSTSTVQLSISDMKFLAVAKDWLKENTGLILKVSRRRWSAFKPLEAGPVFAACDYATKGPIKDEPGCHDWRRKLYAHIVVPYKSKYGTQPFARGHGGKALSHGSIFYRAFARTLTLRKHKIIGLKGAILDPDSHAPKPLELEFRQLCHQCKPPTYPLWIPSKQSGKIYWTCPYCGSKMLDRPVLAKVKEGWRKQSSKK